MWYLLLILAVLILLIIYVIKQSSGYRVVNYEIVSDKLNTDEVKLVLLTDLHNKEYGEENDILISEIDAIAPDFVVFGGDMITSGLDFSYDYSKTLRFMEKLSKKFKVYYGPGNHEEHLREDVSKFGSQYDKFVDSLSKMGIRFLSNESCYIDEYGIRIFGLDLPHYYFRKLINIKLPVEEINNRIGRTDDSILNLLIAHHPAYFDSYVKWGADIVLSGHIHGGIVCLPYLGGVISPGLRLFPKYDFGLFHEGDSSMLVSRGIGTHTIPVRINNKAEIVVLTIKRSK